VAIIARPSRIICLSEEPAETLYLVGKSTELRAFQAMWYGRSGLDGKKKPASSFFSANIDRILGFPISGQPKRQLPSGDCSGVVSQTAACRHLD
jgi:hypothetical protein